MLKGEVILEQQTAENAPVADNLINQAAEHDGIGNDVNQDGGQEDKDNKPAEDGQDMEGEEAVAAETVDNGPEKTEGTMETREQVDEVEDRGPDVDAVVQDREEMIPETAEVVNAVKEQEEVEDTAEHQDAQESVAKESEEKVSTVVRQEETPAVDEEKENIEPEAEPELEPKEVVETETSEQEPGISAEPQAAPEVVVEPEEFPAQEDVVEESAAAEAAADDDQPPVEPEKVEVEEPLQIPVEPEKVNEPVQTPAEPEAVEVEETAQQEEQTVEAVEEDQPVEPDMQEAGVGWNGGMDLCMQNSHLDSRYSMSYLCSSYLYELILYFLFMFLECVTCVHCSVSLCMKLCLNFIY